LQTRPWSSSGRTATFVLNDPAERFALTSNGLNEFLEYLFSNHAQSQGNTEIGCSLQNGKRTSDVADMLLTGPALASFFDER
jgi:hypothetical protein